MDHSVANMALRLQEVENEMRVIRQQLQSQHQEIQYYCQQIQVRDRQTRSSTFLEHVDNFHSMLHSKLSVEPNPELRSTGTTTAIHDEARPVINFHFAVMLSLHVLRGVPLSPKEREKKTLPRNLISGLSAGSNFSSVMIFTYWKFKSAVMESFKSDHICDWLD
ncbi:hypothetical protein E4U49_003281 [Claviceps purpurea]|nr:hypothetical protein E4U49_003281 [Claviceps purpurea]